MEKAGKEASVAEQMLGEQIKVNNTVNLNTYVLCCFALK